MSRPHPTLMMRERKKMTRDILRAVAEDGSIFNQDSPAAKRLLNEYAEVDGDYQGVGRLIDSLVAEGMLTPLISTRDGQPIQARARGITTLGLQELEKLEHPTRTYFEEHLSTWLLVGLTALIAGATITTAVMTVLNQSPPPLPIPPTTPLP